MDMEFSRFKPAYIGDTSMSKLVFLGYTHVPTKKGNFCKLIFQFEGLRGSKKEANILTYFDDAGEDGMTYKILTALGLKSSNPEADEDLSREIKAFLEGLPGQIFQGVLTRKDIYWNVQPDSIAPYDPSLDPANDQNQNQENQHPYDQWQ